MKLNSWRLKLTFSKGAIAKVSLNALYGYVDRLFENQKFVKGGKRLFYDPISSSNKIKNIFVHYGFKYSIEYDAPSGFLLFVTPRQVITSDGNKYDSKFARKNNGRLLEEKEYNFKYRKRCEALQKFDELLGSKRRFNVGTGVQIELELDSRDLSSQTRIVREPEVEFGATKYHTWPGAGLKRFAPLDYNLSLASRPKEIKVLLIGSKKCFKLLKGLNEGESSSNPYAFKGFKSVYKAALKMGQERFIELNAEEIESVVSSEELVDLLLRKAIQVKNMGIKFDICLIELVSEWQFLFANQENDLHDLLKVRFFKNNLITQLINPGSIQQEANSTLYEHLSLGIYFKSGGRPWKLKNHTNNTAYVGITFGSTGDKTKKIIGIAEIFDSYGQYLSIRSVSIKEVSDAININRDFHLTKSQITLLLTDLLQDFRNNSDGNFPENLVIHKTTEFNQSEKQAKEEFRDFPINISMVYIQNDHFYHIITEDGSEPLRGLYWKKSDNETLLYSSGTANAKYFLPGAPIPLVIRKEYSDNFSIEELTEQVVGLTKLNFNSTNTYSKEPVTLLYSRKIVDLLRAGLEASNIPVDPRYYL